MRSDGMALKANFDEILRGKSSSDKKADEQTAEKTINHFKEKMRSFEKGGMSCGLDDVGSKADSG